MRAVVSRAVGACVVQFFYGVQWKTAQGRRHRVQWFAISPIWCKQLFLWVSMWSTHCTHNDCDLEAVDEEYFDGMGLLS
jgi:hypothetical protein